MNIGDTEAKVRKMQLELSANKNQVSKEIAAALAAQNQTATPTVTIQLPPIIQQLYNSDLSHSVETAFHTAATVGDQNYEVANVYTHEKPNPKIITDGAMDAAGLTPEKLTSVTALFEAGDVGAIIIVEGAGPSGGKLVTTIATFNAADEVLLDDAADTTVTSAKARWNLQKLDKVNTIINGAAVVNDALKSEEHTDYDDNINDPDWKRTEGWARLGSTNTLDFFLGTYADDGTTFRPSLYGIQAGRDLYFTCKMAKVHSGVKIRGHFFAGIWNNDERNLEYLSGGGFTVQGTVQGTPAVTATTKYMVVARTDRGFTYFSNILTLADAPDIDSYIPNVTEVELSWSPAIPAVLTYTVYRKIGSGNVEILQVIPNGATATTDNNPITRIDTESTDFPEADDDRTVKAYMATLIDDLDDLVTDGEDNWRVVELFIPMPGSINVSQASELVLRLGLTEPLSLEVTVSIKDDEITSASSFFDALKHEGKTVIVTNVFNSENTLTTTVDTVTDAQTVVLTDAPDWESEENILEILDGEPRGLYLDLFGLGFNRGVWSPNPWDNSRPQLPVSLPGSSNQGGVGSGGIGGGGGQICFLWNSLATDFDTGEFILALDLVKGRRIKNGSGKPSVIKRVKIDFTDRLYQVIGFSGSKSPLVTKSHRFVRNLEDFSHGTPLSRLNINEKLLRFANEQFIIDTIKSVILIDFPHSVPIVSIELEETDLFSRTFLLRANESEDDWGNHNRKYGDETILVT